MLLLKNEIKWTFEIIKLSVCVQFQFLDQITNFQETWYKQNATKRQPINSPPPQ